MQRCRRIRFAGTSTACCISRPRLVWTQMHWTCLWFATTTSTTTSYRLAFY